MELNLNSIHAKLYRWFYGTDTMPKSLCPYFWKLVILYITLLPVTIVSAPMFLYKVRTPLVGKIFGGLFIYGILLVLFMMGLVVASIFGLTLEDGDLLYKWRNIGMGLWIVTIVFGLYFGFEYLSKKLKRKKITIIKEYEDGSYTGRKYYLDDEGERVYVEVKPNLIIEFIKASYNKYCPKITWK